MPEGFRIATAYVQVSPDATGFKEELQEKLDEATAGVSATVPVDADISPATARVDELKGKLDDLRSGDYKARIGADDEDASAAVDETKAKLDGLDGKEARARLGLDKDEFNADLDDAKAKFDRFDGDEARARLGVDKTQFDADMDDAEARLAAFKAESANVNLGGSGSGGGGGGGGGGESGSLLGAIGLGATSLVPGIAGAATGLGMLAGTGALAFGGIGKALSAAHQASENVGLTNAQLASTEFSNAVQIQQAQNTIAEAHEQAAQDSVTSAQSIEQAQMNLAAVERNAAESQVQAEQSVIQAQQQLEESNVGLSMAQRNLAEAWENARETLQQLQDQITDTQIGVQAAQLAVQQAQYQQMLTDQNAYSTSLDRQQAALAVVQAQQQLVEAQQKATDATKQYDLQAQYGIANSTQVVEAKQQVTQAQYAQTDAQMQYADAQQSLTNTELNNADQIKAAQMQVAAAQEQAAYTQMRDAQSVANAQQNLTNTYKEQQLAMAATLSTSNQAANQFEQYIARLTPAGRAFVDQVLGMRSAFRGLEDAAQRAILPGFTVWLEGIDKLMPTIDYGVTKMGGAISAAFGQFGKQMQTPAFAQVFKGLIDNGVQFADVVLPAFAQFIQELARVGGQRGAVSGLANLLAGLAHGLTGLARGIAPYTGVINQFLTAVGHILAATGPALAQIAGLVFTALGPLSRYLDSHPNGLVVKVLGDIVAGLIAVKGLQKILPDFISKPLTELAKSGAGRLLSPFKQAAKELPGVVRETFGPAMSSAGQAVSGFASTAAGKLGQFGSRAGQTMVSAGQSVTEFAAGMGRQLASATRATVVWIGEHAAATASFIAQNVAQATSATAAYIAENAATLGIVAGITALVAAVVFLATHWHQVFTDVKNWTLDVWHNVLDPFFQGNKQLALDLYHKGIYPLWQGIDTAFHGIESVVMAAYHNVILPIYDGWRTATSQVVSDLGKAWSGIKAAYENPVKFLINTVYDDGIRRMWNDVVNAIGLGSLKLPNVKGFAHGGVVPGYAPGHDTVPAMLSPGESVLTPQATQAIGPDTVHALNKQYPSNGSNSGSSSSSGHGSGQLGNIAAREGRRHVQRLGEHALGFAGGGIVGDITGAITGLGHDIISGAKFASELASNPAKAVSGLLSGVIHTNAAGELAKVMTGIPTALIKDLGQAVMNALGAGQGSLPSGSSKALGSLPQNWHTIASFLASHGFTKFAAAGVAGNIEAESGGDPEILEIGGGGGGGLIQWTPYPPSYITGNRTADLMTQLNAILTWGGGPSLVNKATSPSNAALIYQDYYERPANVTASLPLRMASANAVYKAMGWGAFDQGGWLMPGVGPVNQLTQPEAVLTPAQSQALVQLAQNAASRGTDGAAAKPQVVYNFYGTQLPTPEQQAEMDRRLALALSGVTS